MFCAPYDSVYNENVYVCEGVLRIAIYIYIYICTYIGI